MNFLIGKNILQTFTQEPSRNFYSHKYTNFKMSLDTAYENESLNSVWTKSDFLNKTPKPKPDLQLNLKVSKMNWTNEFKSEEDDDVKSKPESNDSPSHHARRPMNAFLIFCKKHRPIVREKFPNLENRGVTRILGEWWAQLDISDKEPYTKLAKEYKDAFLSANPNFKWYKLPAPPLRTLYQRPVTNQKSTSPVLPKVSSPVTTVPEAEFNPGKLADESQLGSITSLMNINSFNNNNSNINNNNNKFSAAEDKKLNILNNNNDDDTGCIQDASLISPLNTTTTKPSDLPPKPLKKRINDSFSDNKSVSRNIFNTMPSQENLQIREQRENHDLDGLSVNDNDSENMTQQELLNKVVDSMFTDNSDDNSFSQNNSTETRKSGRSCKGKRYAKFMVEGKLLGNKRESKLTQQKSIDLNQKFEDELHNKIESCNKLENQTPKLDLGNTIKRLAERTHIKIGDTDDIFNEHKERTRTTSETSDEFVAKSTQNDFNLDMRINNLPSLSYDVYLQRKRESKKRKNHAKSEAAEKKTQNDHKQEVVGSKKRKNKQSITHLDPTSKIVNDLSGLATLAEVAANTERIN